MAVSVQRGEENVMFAQANHGMKNVSLVLSLFNVDYFGLSAETLNRFRLSSYEKSSASEAERVLHANHSHGNNTHKIIMVGLCYVSVAMKIHNFWYELILCNGFRIRILQSFGVGRPSQSNVCTFTCPCHFCSSRQSQWLAVLGQELSHLLRSVTA